MRVALLLLLGGESQNLHVIARDTPAEEPSLSPSSWLPIYLAFSDTRQPRGEGFMIASRRWESRLVAGSLPAWREQTAGYSVAFGWCRVVIVYKFLSHWAA